VNISKDKLLEIKIQKPVGSNDLEAKILDEIKNKVKDYIVNEIEDNQDAADMAIQELINLDKLSFLKDQMIEDNYEFSKNGEEILSSPSNIDSIEEEQIREYIEETPEIKKKLLDLFWGFYFENLDYNKYIFMVLNKMKNHFKFMTSEDISDVKYFVEDVLSDEEEDINPSYSWEGYEDELGQFIKNNFYKKESLTEGKQEDTKNNIIELSKFLKEKLELPYLPKVKFINNDSENASNPLGKTAYYDPNTKNIVLYTLGRHPKDITRSFSHEMVHFKQDLDGRLNNIHTQNVNEDEYLAEIEREAYEKGNMLFRSWENGRKLNEVKIAKPGRRLLYGFNERGRWTELIKAEGFKTKGEILDQINKDFGRDEYPLYIDRPDEETDSVPNPCYVYVTGDGQVYFQGNFNFDSEEEWKVEKWDVIPPKLNEIKVSTPNSIKNVIKVISKKDTEYFDNDTTMYLLDLGKYYTFFPYGGDYDNPAHKLYLVDKDIVEKTKDQDDSDLIKINNDLKSFDLKNHIEQISKNGIEYIK
jgi:hypothetical protein